jgi:hypothetical protein
MQHLIKLVEQKLVANPPSKHYNISCVILLQYSHTHLRIIENTQHQEITKKNLATSLFRTHQISPIWLRWPRIWLPWRIKGCGVRRLQSLLGRERTRNGGGAESSQWRSREGRWIEAAWAVTNLSFSTATLRLREKFSFSVMCL